MELVFFSVSVIKGGSNTTVKKELHMSSLYFVGTFLPSLIA